MTDRYQYDAGGRLTAVSSAETSYEGLPTPARQRGRFAYDLMGRLTHQWDYEADGATLAYERTLAYDARGLVTGDTAYTKRAGGLSKSVTTNGYGAGADYALGAVVTQDTAQYEASPGATQMTLARRSTTTTSYGWSDAARVAKIVHTPDTAQATRYTTTNAYAADGALVSTTIADGRRSRTSSTAWDRRWTGCWWEPLCDRTVGSWSPPGSRRCMGTQGCQRGRLMCMSCIRLIRSKQILPS